MGGGRGCESELELGALVKRATLDGGKRGSNEAQGRSHVRAQGVEVDSRKAPNLQHRTIKQTSCCLLWLVTDIIIEEVRE